MNGTPEGTIDFGFSFFIQAEDGIRYYKVTGVRRVLFRSQGQHPALAVLTVREEVEQIAGARVVSEAPHEVGGPSDRLVLRARHSPVRSDVEHAAVDARSVERRVGKESRSRWVPYL